MKTLDLNKDNDIYISGNGLAIVSGAKCQSVILDTIMNTQQGEIDTDPELGIDYFGTIFQNHLFIEPWAVQVRDVVNKLDFVQEIKSFTYEYDPEDESIQWLMTILNKDGEEIKLGNARNVKDGSVIKVGSDWKNISGRPENIELAIKTIEAMRKASGENLFMKPSDTMNTVKETINETVISPLADDSNN